MVVSLFSGMIKNDLRVVPGSKKVSAHTRKVPRKKVAVILGLCPKEPPASSA